MDNCLTNNEAVFSKCYPVNAQIKTNDKACILPAGIKLKPLRFKQSLRDYREHRKIKFHQGITEQNWIQINDMDLEDAVDFVHSTIESLMDECFPSKMVKMSSRDPPWMSPLVKLLLKKKSRCQKNGGRGVSDLTEKIGRIISENRRKLASGKLGSCSWWKKVDVLTLREENPACCLDDEFICGLNDFLANLCFDNSYIKPIPAVVDADVSVPQLTNRQVHHALSKIKRTATGPDGIPFWVWKDYAAIFTSVIGTLWNKSLAQQKWPSRWKEANIKPLAVNIPSEYADFRGINVTPVIARCFKRTVHYIFNKNCIEDFLNDSQFAYRRGGSCVNALLKMQHSFLAALDKKDTLAVRMFTMDFSKAFDNVKHHLLVEKLKNSPLNPYIVNWFVSFLANRRQRVIYNGVLSE